MTRPGPMTGAMTMPFLAHAVLAAATVFLHRGHACLNRLLLLGRELLKEGIAGADLMFDHRGHCLSDLGAGRLDLGCVELGCGAELAEFLACGLQGLSLFAHLGRLRMHDLEHPVALRFAEIQTLQPAHCAAL